MHPENDEPLIQSLVKGRFFGVAPDVSKQKAHRQAMDSKASKPIISQLLEGTYNLEYTSRRTKTPSSRPTNYLKKNRKLTTVYSNLVKKRVGDARQRVFSRTSSRAPSRMSAADQSDDLLDTATGGGGAWMSSSALKNPGRPVSAPLRRRAGAHFFFQPCWQSKIA